MPSNDYITLRDAAEEYGVSERTIRRRIGDGTLPAFRVGPRSIRVSRSDVAALARPIPPDACDSPARILMATHDDGSQTLVTLWGDGAGEVASRSHSSATWGVPSELLEVSQ